MAYRRKEDVETVREFIGRIVMTSERRKEILVGKLEEILKDNISCKSQHRYKTKQSAKALADFICGCMPQESRKFTPPPRGFADYTLGIENGKVFGNNQAIQKFWQAVKKRGGE